MIGVIVGGLIAGLVGLWLANRQRISDGKGRFMAAICRQQALLDLREDNWKDFHRESLMAIHGAIFDAKPFTGESQFACLRELWGEYKERGKKERGWLTKAQLGSVGGALGVGTAPTSQGADEWIKDFLHRFETEAKKL